MDEDDVAELVELDEELDRAESFWCPHHRRHHRRKEHLFIDLLLGTPTRTSKEQIHMAEASITVSPAVPAVDGSVGSVRDVDGNVNTTDPVVSGTWSVADASLGSIAAPDGLTCVVALTGTEGTLSGSFSGTTAAGVTVTGAFSIICQVGPPSTVDINLVAESAAPAPAPVPEVPAAPTA